MHFLSLAVCAGKDRIMCGAVACPNRYGPKDSGRCDTYKIQKVLTAKAVMIHCRRRKGGLQAEPCHKRQCPPGNCESRKVQCDRAGRRGEGSIEGFGGCPSAPLRVRTQSANMRVTAKQRDCDRGTSDKWLRVCPLEKIKQWERMAHAGLSGTGWCFALPEAEFYRRIF